MFKKAFIKTLKTMLVNILIIVFIVFLIALINNVFSASLYSKLFHHNIIFDSIIGALLGSISVGSPTTSYVLAGEFLKQGISLIAVSSFIVAWTTVGIIQLPYETKAFNKKFAFYRNFFSFISAIIVSILAYLIFNFI